MDGWLHCVNQYGIRGLVPASYVRILSANEDSADVAAQLFGGYGMRQVAWKALHCLEALLFTAKKKAIER